MDRHFSLSYRPWPLWCCVAVLVLTGSGCSLVATAMYVITGNNVEADFSGLRGKKVAVVCRPVTTLEFSNTSAAGVLASQVGSLLEQNVRNVQVIDQHKVADWTDENTWEDFTEIGKALGADMVVGIDLESFDIHSGQTLLQGKANVTLLVYDIQQGKSPVYQKHLPQAVFPPSAPIPVTDKPEAQFRRQFVGKLAEQIARHFYNHDAGADFAADSTVLNDAE